MSQDYTKSSCLKSPILNEKIKAEDTDSWNSSLTSPSKNFQRNSEDFIDIGNDHNIKITVKKLKEPEGNWI